MPIEKPRRFHTTPLQQGMIFHNLSHPGSGIDIEQITLSCAGRLDADQLVKAFEIILERHDVLRSRFELTDDEPVCVVDPSASMPMKIVEADAGSEGTVLSCAKANDRAEDFDLAVAPLMRGTLVRGAQADTFCWTFHHLLLDGRSFAPLLEELLDLLSPAGEEPEAPANRVSFFEYTDWLERRDSEESMPFWRDYLAPVAEPCVFPRLGNRAASGNGVAQHYLDDSLSRQIESYAQHEGSSVNAVLQLAWATLLSQYCGESRVTFGATYTMRHVDLPGAESILGLMINTLPVTLDLSSDESSGAYLRMLTAHARAVRPHITTPLHKVQHESPVAGGESLFNTAVIFDRVTLDDDMKQRRADIDHLTFEYEGQTNFPLALVAYGGEHIMLRVEYQEGYLDASHAHVLIGCLRNVLTQLCEEPERSPGQISLLSPTQRRSALQADIRRTETPLLTLHGRFREIAARFADRCAVRHEQKALSYAELDARSDRIAAALHAHGVRPDDFVGLCLPRGMELVVALLGILKAGAAYVPVDPNYPDTRIRFTLEDSGTRCVLTDETIAERLVGMSQVPIVASEAEQTAARTPDVPSEIDSTAYIIYTSGSTGRPKGVAVTHRNVARLMASTQAWFGFDETDRWTLFHSIAFDWSVFEIWGAFTYGGELTVVPYWVSRSPPDFDALLIERQITVLCQTPSAFANLIEIDLDNPPVTTRALRFVIFGGEALDLASLEPWVDRYGDEKPRLINMYGITETTVHVTYRRIREADIREGVGSVIGEPIPDLDILLLDERFEPVPPGVVAEIFVAGEGVGRYHDRPDLDAERFVTGVVDGRLYRSGDLARRLPSGELIYVGRSDFQVKIRGFRIELGEIEGTLTAAEDVQRAVVLAPAGPGGHPQLVCYYTGAADSEALRTYAAASLPAHMVPAHIIRLPEFPLTANGKIDSKKLPAPQSKESSRYQEPRNQLERQFQRLFEETLGSHPIGVSESFFDRGGDSILIIKLISRARREGVALTVRQVYDNPSIAGLAATSLDAGASSTMLPDNGSVPLLPVQAWYFDAIGHHDQWNQCYLFDVAEAVTPERLAASLEALLREHPVLGTVFSDDSGEWTQAVAKGSCAVDSFDVIDAASRDRAIRSVNRAISPRDGTNLSAALLWHDGGRVELCIAIHHLVVDGVSWNTLIHELDDWLFRADGSEDGSQPEADYLSWCKLLDADGDRFLGEIEFWRQRVAPRGQSDATYRHDRREERVVAFDKVGRIAETSIDVQTITVAAFAGAVAEISGNKTVHVDTESHGRVYELAPLAFDRAVGWFTSIYPLSIDVSSGGELLALLAEARTALNVPHNGIGYGILTQKGHLRAEPATYLFNYMGYFERLFDDCDNLVFQPSPPYEHWRDDGAGHPYAVEWMLSLEEAGIRIDVLFDSSVHSQDRIERLVDLFCQRLAAITKALREAPIDLDHLLLAPSQVLDVQRQFGAARAVLPLTPIQELYLFGQVGGIDTGVESWYIRYQGNVDSATLRRAWEETLSAHAGLCTRFPLIAGASVQVFEANTSMSWQSLELDPSADLELFTAQEVRLGLDVANGPMHRFTFMEGNNEAILVWTHHHLQVDGWSWPLILLEVALRYAGGKPEAEPADYIEYSRWLRRDRPPVDAAYWKSLLGNLGDAGRLPHMHTGQVGHANKKFRIDESLTEAIEAEAGTRQVSLSAVCHAAVATTLARLMGRDRVCVGSTFAGRPTVKDFTATVGPFVTNLPVFVNAGEMGVVSSGVHEAMLQLQERQFHSSAEIQQAAEVPWIQPIFECLVVFQNYGIDDAMLELEGGARLTELYAPVRTNYPLTCVIVPRSSISIQVLYDSARLDPTFAERLISGLRAQLESFAFGTAAPIAAPTYADAEYVPAPVAPRGDAPSSALETKLLGIWGELFGLEGIGVTDSFFDLGGRSIMVPLLMRRIREETGLTVSFASLYREPTVAGLARTISVEMMPIKHAKDRSRNARSARQRARRKRQK